MKTHSFDRPLLIVSAILIVLGILILAGVSAVFSQEQFGKPTYFLFHQILYGAFPGLILGFLAFRIPLPYIKKWIFPLFLINLIFLGLVFVPQIGFQSGGATRWIGLGPFSFQPAEFLKITFLLYLAALIASRNGDSFSGKKENRRLWPDVDNISCSFGGYYFIFSLTAQCRNLICHFFNSRPGLFFSKDSYLAKRISNFNGDRGAHYFNKNCAIPA